VSNVGGAAVADVTLVLTLPPGAGAGVSDMREIPGFGWDCDVAALPVLTCTHGPLEAGATIGPARLPTTMPAGTVGGTLTVTASVGTSDREANRANNTARTGLRYVTAPRPGDLTVSLTAGPSEVAVGGQVVLRAVVHQVGAFAAPYARVDLPLPDTMLPLSPSTGSPGWDCRFGRDVITGVSSWLCSHGPIGVGEATEPLEVLAQVVTAAPGDVIPFTATVSTAAGEDSTANNTAQTSLSVIEAT
jgi:hypothetical protein